MWRTAAAAAAIQETSRAPSGQAPYSDPFGTGQPEIKLPTPALADELADFVSVALEAPHLRSDAVIAPAL